MKNEIARNERRTSRRRLAQRGSRRAAATVEFALCLPVVFTLFFGAVEMSRLNAVRNTIDNAAYEGARRAILPGATKAKVDAKANTILTAGSIRRARITMNPPIVRSSTPRVTVTIEVRMDENSWVAPIYSKGLRLRRSCTLSRELALGN